MVFSSMKITFLAPGLKVSGQFIALYENGGGDKILMMISHHYLTITFISLQFQRNASQGMM